MTNRYMKKNRNLKLVLKVYTSSIYKQKDLRLILAISVTKYLLINILQHRAPVASCYILFLVFFARLDRQIIIMHINE